jgi:protein-disulfide isomerase/uncharacterized membrane protein
MAGDKGQNIVQQFSIISILLAVIGLGISLYSLQHHLAVKAEGQTEAFCNINQTFNCDDVALSKYSEDPYGNPLGVYGIGYFLGLIVLVGVALAKEAHRREALQAYAFLVGVGSVGSIVLALISYFDIGAFCLTCIGVYLTTWLLAAVLIFQRSVLPGGWKLKELANGISYPLVTLLAVIGLFQVLGPSATSTSPEFTPDHAKTEDQVKRIMEQMEQRQKQIAKNREILTINRSPYSGLGEDYRKGPDNAPVTIVEFADFQCPACQQASGVLEQIHKEFSSQVQVVFKNYPLDSNCNPSVSREIHPYACDAAILARCAGRFGKFWPMHNKIFHNQSKIDGKRLELWALEVGLSEDQIQECRQSDDLVAKIRDDIKQANALGLSGTPTIYINGMKAEGRSVDQLRRTINNFLTN